MAPSDYAAGIDTKPQPHCLGCGLPLPCPVRLQLAPGTEPQDFCGIECLHLHLDGCREAIDGAPERNQPGDAVVFRRQVPFDHVINELCDESAEYRSEVAHVLRAAGRRIALTMLIARRNGKYGPYSWKVETEKHQGERAVRHVHNYLAKTSPYYIGAQDTRGRGGEADAPTEVEHALTRLAFLAAMLDTAAGR